MDLTGYPHSEEGNPTQLHWKGMSPPKAFETEWKRSTHSHWMVQMSSGFPRLELVQWQEARNKLLRHGQSKGHDLWRLASQGYGQVHTGIGTVVGRKPIVLGVCLRKTTEESLKSYQVRATSLAKYPASGPSRADYLTITYDIPM